MDSARSIRNQTRREMQHMSANTANTAHSVTVLGLGPMGQAMVRAFLAAGTEVTVWNRSPEKVDAMVELGARRAATVAEALDANALIVISLTHYAAMYDVLGQARDHLAGKVIANLSSDSPVRAREGAQWVRSHGARFISGGVMSAGDNLTHPASYIFYSGPREVFDAVSILLSPLSPQEYLGADDGLAQIFYQAGLIVFHPWMLALDQAFAVIERSGHQIDQFLPYVQRATQAYPHFIEEFAAAAKVGGWGTEAGLRMMDAGAQHIIEASEEVGVDATLSHASQGLWRRAIAASEQEGRAVPVYEVISGGPA
ncbi:NAD(P)-dependent oxidoreductase [Nocardia panacis]|uniref:NAD(P)-dependent oxidoreductase n=1 Tax=Nocardia panacis TaxID=2340916 RepID=A0A3A4KPI3_9NOCA|nr:NAD(P)-binding domain-containing protein [Nocardia panacis]RJO77257.1 NAD(P)-dependent oxidoreductase [Nocardia panacis]